MAQSDGILMCTSVVGQVCTVEFGSAMNLHRGDARVGAE